MNRSSSTESGKRSTSTIQIPGDISARRAEEIRQRAIRDARQSFDSIRHLLRAESDLRSRQKRSK